MGQAAFDRPQFTIEQYHAWEEAASSRHEYFRGEIYAMAGGSPSHTRIIGRVTTALNNHMDGSGCYAAPSDQRVRIEAADIVFYPDVAVVCEGAEYDPQDRHAVTNPHLLVEVLSPSTARYDRTTKLEAYKLISSSPSIIIVWQDTIRVQQHFRDEAGEWQVENYTRRSDSISIRGLEIELTAGEFYGDLDLPEGTLELVP